MVEEGRSVRMEVDARSGRGTEDETGRSTRMTGETGRSTMVSSPTRDTSPPCTCGEEQAKTPETSLGRREKERREKEGRRGGEEDRGGGGQGQEQAEQRLG